MSIQKLQVQDLSQLLHQLGCYLWRCKHKLRDDADIHINSGEVMPLTPFLNLSTSQICLGNGLDSLTD